MGVRSWLGNKLFNIDSRINNKVREVLNMHDRNVDMGMMSYREKEYKTWAVSSPDKLLEFYKQNTAPEQYPTRLLFWQWVGGRNVPMVHYPAPEALINHMKSLLFGSEITIETGDDKLDERLAVIFEEINLYDLLQKAALMETYSGTIAAKFIVDSEVSDAPIVEIYPKERLELTTKYNKVIEIVFKDYYKHKDKSYTLRSYYGRGYIKYLLWDDKNKEVPLGTVPELAELKDKEYNTKRILAVYKKNKATSNEFSDSPYGGSDFEGVTDLFHSIDEIYSSMMLYIRRMRPMLSVTEDLLPTSKDGMRKVIPKEYEFDVVPLKATDNAKNVDAKIYRDAPELVVAPYIDSINQLFKSIYQKVGMSYTSVGLEAHAANISGAALIEKEKPTIIVRNNKIKLWRPFLIEFSQLLLWWEDVLNNKTPNDYDIDIFVTFPDYAEETFEERVEQLDKAMRAGLLDNYTANETLWDGEYDEEKIKEISRNAKIEQGMTLMENDID